MFAVSVGQSVRLSVMRLNCVWCIRATFVKLLWPLVHRKFDRSGILKSTTLTLNSELTFEIITSTIMIGYL